jgi:predicted cupin superfamily sugar epimerase
MYTAIDLINYYELIAHPEGGYFKETYRAVESIAHTALPGRFKGIRNFSTAIYFLLQENNFSSFHRIQSDECWHFYTGGRLLVHVIGANGNLETHYLGSDFLNGEKFQFVVQAGCWFAAETAPGTSFSFVGCTVAPGFDFEDFELANADELSRQYPQHEILIRRLTK